VEEFEVPGAAGRPIRGDIRYAAADASHAHPAPAGVVMCHGFKGFARWGFVPYLADRVAAAGLSVVTFDFSGSGVGADREHFTEPAAFADNTFARERYDLDVVIDTARSRGWIGDGNGSLGLFGFSRGGGVAILRAASDTPPKAGALVTWSSIAYVDRWTTEEHNAWRTRGHREVPNTRTGEVFRVGTAFLDEIETNGASELDLLSAAGRISERAIPWLIVHGEADETIGVHEGRQLHTASRDRAELAVIEHASHTYNAKHGMTEPTPELAIAADRTVRFLRANLPVLESGS
jgi:alpha-beta hydrolase superfamily lysophospholipase